MTVLIRVDGYQSIGRGHIMRTIALAQEFRSRQIRVIFLIFSDDISEQLVQKQGFDVIRFNKNIEEKQTLAILKENKIAIYISDVDYLSSNFFNKLKQMKIFTVQIDIIRDASLSVNLLINGGIYAPDYYRNLDYSFNLLAGADYALLRKEFRSLPPKLIQDDIHQILVLFGATDVNNITSSVVSYLSTHLPNIHFIAVGKQLEQLEKLDNVTSYTFVDNIIELYKNVDLVICGGGVTLYELAASGTPAIIITQADNQVLQTEYFANEQTCLYHSRSEDIDLGLLRQQIIELNDKDKRIKMSMQGQKMVDGLGVERAVDYIIGGLNNE